MINMQNKKTPMRKQSPKEAIGNFDEVNFGYNFEEAITEASRCLNCKNHPCVDACPLHNNIPLINQLISDGKFSEAYKVSINNNPLSSICGRVCEQDSLCEKDCVRGLKIDNDPVAIGNLERFLGDYFAKYRKDEKIKCLKSTGKRVAIIGSGPAALSCAEVLAKNCVSVDIFEKNTKFGGLLRYGIPSFVLDRSVIDFKIKFLKENGVIFHANRPFSEKMTLKDLLEKNKFDAVFLANGANEPRKMGILNENCYGSYDSKTYLSLNNAHRFFMKIHCKEILTAKHVVVVGGGNVAIDVDRVAIRNGASDVHNLYRRSEKEMPVRREEYINAVNEGIIFDFLCNPIELKVDKGTNRIKGLVVQKMKLGELDSSGRCSPIPIKGSEFTVPCDLIVFALGASSDVNVTKLLPVDVIDKKGLILINQDTCKTSIPHVFAGGDNVLGPSFVVYAVDHGKKAAMSIMEDILK